MLGNCSPSLGGHSGKKNFAQKRIPLPAALLSFFVSACIGMGGMYMCASLNNVFLDLLFDLNQVRFGLKYAYPMST